MRLQKSNTFYCFSPPVMIATFAIEVIFAVYTIWRYKFNKLARLVVAALFFLAAFQFAEYFICTTGNSYNEFLSRLGYMSITMLPPIGIHIIATLRNFPGAKYVISLAYASALAFVSWFLLYSGSLTGHACQGNYVIFHVEESATIIYGIYYYGWVIAGLAISSLLAARTKVDIKTKQALLGVSLGYAGFIIPTTTANFLNADTLSGIPSIMCGFAVILAITLVTIVMPNEGTKRKK